MENITSASGGRLIPRSLISVGLDPGLRSSLPERSSGQLLVIDFFRSWQCGTWIGDLTVSWLDAEPGPEFAELAPIEGVRLFANRRLLRLLRDGGAILQRGRLPFRGGLTVTLDRPELWIDYLDRPSSFELPEV